MMMEFGKFSVRIPVNADFGRRGTLGLFGSYLKHLLGYSVAGILLNGILFQVLDPLAHVNEGDPNIAEGTTQFMVLGVIVLAPLAFALWGHRQGLLAAGYFLAKGSRAPMVKSILEATFRSKPGWLKDLNASKQALKENLRKKSSGTLNAGVIQRMVWGVVMKRLKASETLTNMMAAIDQTFDAAASHPGSDEEKIAFISTTLGSKINLDFLKPKTFLFPFLVLANVALAHAIPAVNRLLF